MTESIPFRGFDERGDVRVYYHGILPHWRQDGCTYFVTYRQADSLPAGTIREFEFERDKWLKHRGVDLDNEDRREAFRKLSRADRRTYERLMASRLNECLDAGHGSCMLRRSDIAQIVIKSLYHFHGERVQTGDSVVMPNHVHTLMRPMPGYELEDVLQAIKSFTATEINRQIGAGGRFWMKESYDHIVRDFDQLAAFQNYIIANPKKARLRQDEFVIRTATWRPDE